MNKVKILVPFVDVTFIYDQIIIMVNSSMYALKQISWLRRYLKMPPTAVNTHGDAIRIMQTARKTINYFLPLMARSSMLCGMDDQVKHACTIGYSIPPITSIHR